MGGVLSFSFGCFDFIDCYDLLRGGLVWVIRLDLVELYLHFDGTC